ncbi:MAG: hypothetical protein QM783_18190 [Phycisphaerales bacterium]
MRPYRDRLKDHIGRHTAQDNLHAERLRMIGHRQRLHGRFAHAERLTDRLHSPPSPISRLSTDNRRQRQQREQDDSSDNHRTHGKGSTWQPPAPQSKAGPTSPVYR